MTPIQSIKLFLLSCLLFFIASPLHAQTHLSYDQQWQEIDSLENLGLPKSALKKTMLLYQKAVQEKNKAQLIKALIHRSKFQIQTEETQDNDALARELLRIEEALRDETMPAKAILQSMLGELYFSYLQSQSWKINQRTQTKQFTKEDISSWSSRDYYEKAMYYYNQSIASVELHNEPLSAFKPLLTQYTNQKGKEDFSLCPTLFDFLLQRAIRFYSNEQTYLTKPAYQFYVEGAEFFSPAREFIKIPIATQDTFSAQYNVIRLYQKALKLHLSDKDQKVLMEYDLNRIAFVFQKSIHADKNNLYLASLEKFIAANASSPKGAEALAMIARYYVAQGEKYKPSPLALHQWDIKKAIQYCDKAISIFPFSKGGIECAYIKSSIERPSLQLVCEKVSLPESNNLIKLTYKNVDKVYFKIVRLSNQLINNAYFDETEDEQYNTEKKIKTLLQQPEVSRGEETLPSMHDYQLHATELKIDPLPVGRYGIVYSTHKDFDFKNSYFVYQTIIVSNISYIAQPDYTEGTVRYYALNRKTGAPMANVKAEFYSVEYNYNKRKYQTKIKESGVTDQNGLVKSHYTDNSVIPKFYSGKDILFEYNPFHAFKQPEQESPDRYETQFFIDRGIYRPGQTVYFKAIVTFHRKNEPPAIAPNKAVIISFKDANYQEVKTLSLVTNEYGTVSGTFVAPTGGMNGEMHLESSLSGAKYFRIEEYKRPKFEVHFNAIDRSYTIGDTIQLAGAAKSFAGAPLAHTSVAYRVIRKTHFPSWPWWRYGWYIPYQQSDMELAHGLIKTNEKGEFNIQFLALADKSIPKDQQPQFSFEVIADVTDITGETHSDKKSITVGYIGINASISAPNKIQKDSTLLVSINTLNLNGNHTPTQCTLIIDQVKQPEKIYSKRYWEVPDLSKYDQKTFQELFPSFAYKNEDQFPYWEIDHTVYNKVFNTKDIRFLSVNDFSHLPSGLYKLTLRAQDKSGELIEDIHYVTSYNINEKKLPVSAALDHLNNSPVLAAGNKGAIFIGTSLYKQSVLLEKTFYGKILEARWIELSGIQKINFTDSLDRKGQFQYRFVGIHNNRAYTSEIILTVPFPSKDLTIDYATFREKLLPGANEEWVLKLSGPKGEKVMAEMVAAMYDASLDQFANNHFDYTPAQYMETNYHSGWEPYTFESAVGLAHNSLLPFRRPVPEASIIPQLNWFNYPINNWNNSRYGLRSAAPMVMESDAIGGEDKRDVTMDALSNIPDKKIANKAVNTIAVEGAPGGKARSKESVPSSSKDQKGSIQVRTNLQETVFFYPHLYTDETGQIIIKFKMNEALTRWKFIAMAHTKELMYASTKKEIITQKDLMITPNMPRFLRVGDQIVLTAKIDNLSEQVLQGEATLLLFDALTNKPIDVLLQNTKNIVPFYAEKGLSASVKWNISIPEGIEAVTYRVIAQAGNYSDGEESTLPVLTNKMLVTESMPLPIRGGQSKSFEFKSMSEKSKSPTLKHQHYTLEFTTNPVWYAVQALPYIMEYPHECTEQLFSRYYANALAGFVTEKHPNIRKVFDAWRGTEAMKSNLSKNEALKTALLEETPWVMEAQREEVQKQNIALLFDLNKLAQEEESTLKKIMQRQSPNGGFSWFPGGIDNWYITQYLLEGFGHLDHLHVRNNLQNNLIEQVIQKGIQYIDARIAEDYEKLLSNIKRYGGKLEENHLHSLAIHYLYTRSFYNYPIEGKTKIAYEYYSKQCQQYWTTQSIYLQGMISLALFRQNRENPVAKNIVKSLRERAFNNEEMGMYWKYNPGYFWDEMPIETHSLMIEVFDEVARDAKAVDDLKVWLLKNKQTNSWKTTKASASAVYALLNTGDNWLENSKDMNITIGGTPFDYNTVRKEAGSGYFKTSWNKELITPALGNIQISNPNAAIAWGAVYWQYFEQLDKITGFRETPLKIKKQLFKEINTSEGPVLQPIESAALAPGDKIKVRILLTVDREMEYIHMKDARASGFEPLNVLSVYKYQEGLGYYEITHDGATHFFFDYLPKGNYVFEYPLMVNHRGDFSNGITTIQSMYAPEFSSHSAGVRVTVK